MEEVEQFLIAEPPEEFTCPICTNILSQPIQTACGHHFCESCLDDWLRKCEKAQEEMLCPTCRQNPIPKFLDKAMNRKINQIEIKCKNFTRGCLWKGAHELFIIHRTECANEIISCEFNCGFRFERKHKAQHEIECERRLIRCEYCEAAIQLNEKKIHEEICENFPVSCEKELHGCGKIVTRKDFKEYHEELMCPFESCAETLRKCQLNAHLQNELFNHLFCLQEYFTCELERVTGLIEEEKQKNFELTKVVEEQKVEIQMLSRKFEANEKNVLQKRNRELYENNVTIINHPSSSPRFAPSSQLPPPKKIRNSNSSSSGSLHLNMMDDSPPGLDTFSPPRSQMPQAFKNQAKTSPPGPNTQLQRTNVFNSLNRSNSLPTHLHGNPNEIDIFANLPPGTKNFTIKVLVVHKSLFSIGNPLFVFVVDDDKTNVRVTCPPLMAEAMNIKFDKNKYYLITNGMIMQDNQIILNSSSNVREFKSINILSTTDSLIDISP